MPNVLSGQVGGPLVRPISEALDAELTKLRGQVPTGKRGYATVGASLTGMEAGIGFKPKPWLDFSGYASKQWSGGGWTAGARVNVIF